MSDEDSKSLVNTDIAANAVRSDNTSNATKIADYNIDFNAHYNKVKIRKATLDDLQLIKRLEPSYSKDHKELLKYYIQKRGIFIAENKEKNVVEGYILSQILNWINNKHKIVWIEHIYINPKNKNWIIQRLLTHIKEYYRHLIPDIQYVFGNVQPTNKELLKLTRGLESVSFFGTIND